MKAKYIEGQTVGQLKLIERIYNLKANNKSQMWLTECKCGHRQARAAWYLSKIKNPSCRNCWRSHKYTGTEHIDGSKWSELLNGALAKNRNRKEDIPVTITIDDAERILVEQDFKCKYTGLPLTFSKWNRETKKVDRGTASLDRVDSLGGYTLDNVVWVHKDVNKMKMNFSLDRFVEVCSLVTANLGTQDEH